MAKTQSEERFEAYLRAFGVNDFVYEEPVLGRRKLVDYRIAWGGQHIYCDLKERPAKAEADGAYAFDPYKVWRKKIEKARVKFEEYEDCCCAVICYNLGDFNMWCSPHVIFGAMLGDLGATPGGQNVFLPYGGKLVDYAKQNYSKSCRTISAVIALEDVTLKNFAFDRTVEDECQDRGIQSLGDASALIAIELLLERGPTFERVPRLIVCEHPDPWQELPRSLFNGCFDERWGIVNGKLTRLYAGARIGEIQR